MEGKIQRRCITIHGVDALERLKPLEKYGWRLVESSTNFSYSQSLRNGITEVLLSVTTDKLMTSTVLPQDYGSGEIPEEEDAIVDISKKLTVEKIDHDLSRTWTDL